MISIFAHLSRKTFRLAPAPKSSQRITPSKKRKFGEEAPKNLQKVARLDLDAMDVDDNGNDAMEVETGGEAGNGFISRLLALQSQIKVNSSDDLGFLKAGSPFPPRLLPFNPFCLVCVDNRCDCSRFL